MSLGYVRNKINVSIQAPLSARPFTVGNAAMLSYLTHHTEFHALGLHLNQATMRQLCFSLKEARGHDGIRSSIKIEVASTGCYEMCLTIEKKH